MKGFPGMTSERDLPQGVPPPTPSLPAPSQLAQFEVIRRLGAGGMAEVFLAKKRGAEGTYKILVVKRILPSYGASRRFRSMFIEEAQLATRLNHPNVVQVYDFFDEGGDVGQLLAMEYVEGPDLGRLMSAARAQGTRLPPWLAAWIIAEAAKGLHYAHDKRDEGGAPLEIVHRDVSPQNILLSFEGSVKIADFGIASARVFEDDAGVLKGKFGYMSPEQARAEKVDRRSDLYALGVILWEMITGRALHGGLGGEALLDMVRSGMVEPPSAHVEGLPEELEAIVLRALAADREQRFASGRDLAATVARALLARQELVDAGTLEAFIAQLVPRDALRPGDSAFPQSVGSDGGRGDIEQRTQAAVPMALSHEGTVQPTAERVGVPPPRLVTVTHEAPPPPEVPGRGAPEPRGREGPREVRHVAVVTLRLHGLEGTGGGPGDGVLAQRTLERLRAMLGDIAYKRRVKWVWSGDRIARAVAGIETNPTRAASDAAWLALDTHEAISGLGEDLPFEMGASIGIVRGIASGVRDPQGHLVRYQLHDPAPYLAELLGRQTPVRATWVAGGVYRLVRREFRWGDAPALAIEDEGVDLPPVMRMYALQRSLSREERLLEAANAPSDLVGRDTEKADLHSAFHGAVSGHGGGGTVTCRALVGEMGIGKTALVATFLSELPPNARVVRAECSPVRMEVPYSAVSEVIRDALGVRGDETPEDVESLLADALGASPEELQNPMLARLGELATGRMMPGPGAAPGQAGDDEDAHYRRKLLVGGVRLLLSALGTKAPLVVVVESLQWADRPSLDLLLEILRGPSVLPVLVLLVTRPDERIMPVLQGIMRVELRGLSADEQVRLVEARLGVQGGVRAVLGEVLPRVGGNPFFLLEMVDALLERGALEIHETADGTTTGAVLSRSDRSEADLQGLPSTLEQLLADRLHELPEAERTIVDWLAVAGGPLSDHDLGRLVGDGDEDAVVRLCARGLCDRKGDAVDFRHALTRDVAYVDLPASRRTRMHRALGEHLAQTSLARGLSAAIVARHLARGEAGLAAAAFYLEAAGAARTGYQTQLAVRYFQRALAFLPEGDGRRLLAHEALEAIFRMLGRRRERVRHLEGLRDVARGQRRGRPVILALLRTARFHQDEGALPKGLEAARQAASIARNAGLTSLELEGEALVSEFLRELGDVQGALAACDRALHACDAKDRAVSARTRAEVLRSRGVLLRRVGRVREAVDAYVDAIALFRKAGALRQEARAKHALAYGLFVQGRYEDAIALAHDAVQIVLSIGGRIQLANTMSNIGQAYARLGDFPRAMAYFRRARDAHERSGDQDAYADTLIVTAEVLVETGELHQAETLLDDASALTASTGNAYDLAHLAIVRAALCRARGEHRTAVDHALAARRAAESQALVSFHFYGLALEAAARADAGELHTATLLATTALGAVETLQGCEYGLEIRVLCAHALLRANSPQAQQVRKRAVDFAHALMNTVRDKRLRRSFADRPLAISLFAEGGTYCAVPGVGSIPPPAPLSASLVTGTPSSPPPSGSLPS